VKVATKLALAVILIMVSVFATRAYEGAERQIALAQRGIEEVQFIIARALRPAVKELWTKESPERALDLLALANDRIRRARDVEIHWVPFQPQLPETYEDRLTPGELARLKRDVEYTVHKRMNQRQYTYVPVLIGGRPEGALEISESLTHYEDEVKAEVMGVLRRSAGAALASILAVSLLGFVIVGRPMRRLAEKARRIGAGDLDGPLALRQRDEIGELGREMNDMCDRLRDAQSRIHQETAARIGALEQLRHADRLTTVGTLASGIPHELGTPLNVVSGRAKMIATGEVAGEEALDSARIIVEQVDRITKIIRQLLDFARRRAPERGRHGLRALAEQTLALLQPIAQKRNVVLIGPTADAQAEIDAAQIQQALTNLVVNGIQAMPRGGRLEVTVGIGEAIPPPDIAGRSGLHASIGVSDEGLGIAPEDLPRVFEPFFTTKEVGEGTGLGLSVAHGIARDHGGWIEVQSQPGRGSRFTLYVPAAGSAATPEGRRS
jgi:signal transduction histidine kinase